MMQIERNKSAGPEGNVSPYGATVTDRAMRSAGASRAGPRRLGAVRWPGGDWYQPLSMLAVPVVRIRSLRVSIHALTFLLLAWVVFETYWFGGAGGSALAMVPPLIGVAVFLGVSLIRESAKWFCVRYVAIGGEADTIRLWPLGSLSTHRLMRRHGRMAWLTTLIGPAVTMSIAVLAGLVLFAVQGPTFTAGMNFFAPGQSLAQWSSTLSHGQTVTSAQYWLLISFWWTFQAGLSLTAAHLLLLMPPFDGADLLELIWSSLEKRNLRRMSRRRADPGEAAAALLRDRMVRAGHVLKLTAGIVSAATLLAQAIASGCIPALFVVLLGLLGSAHQWRCSRFIDEARATDPGSPDLHEPADDQSGALQPTAAEMTAMIGPVDQLHTQPSEQHHHLHTSADQRGGQIGTTAEGARLRTPEPQPWSGSASVAHGPAHADVEPTDSQSTKEPVLPAPQTQEPDTVIPDEKEIDHILEHISRNGINSLTARERKMLEAATAQRRHGYTSGTHGS